MENKRFYNLDFFKIVFTILILIIHTIGTNRGSNFYQSITNFRGDFIVVEFFFLLSGFFLYLTYDKYKNINQFMLLKWIRFVPVIILQVFLVDFVLSNKKTDILISLGLLQGTGIQNNFYVHWFVSSLFWSSVVYFIILTTMNKTKAFFVIGLLVYFSYLILLVGNNKSLDIHVKTLSLFFNGSFLRGLGGVGLGCIIANLTKIFIEKYPNNKTGNILFTAIEIIVLFLITNRLFWDKKYTDLTDFNMVILFSMLIFLSYIQKGIILKSLNLKCFKPLSSYIYSIYVMQTVGFFMVNKLYGLLGISKTNIYTFIGEVVFCILLGIITYYLIEKPLFALLNKKIRG